MGGSVRRFASVAQEQAEGRRYSFQASNARQATEGFVKSDDFVSTALERNLSNQVIGEPDSANSRGFQSLRDQSRRLDSYAPRLEKAFDCV